MAGHSQDDDGNQQLLLGEIDADGQYVSDFCGSGRCAGIRVLWIYEGPSGIAERSATRDLVVALTLHDDSGTGADAIHSRRRCSSAAAAMCCMCCKSWTTPALLLFSDERPADRLEQSVLAGTREWSAATIPCDSTLTRLIDTDTISTNQFETVF